MANTLWCDNKFAVYLDTNSIYNELTKHIKINCHDSCFAMNICKEEFIQLYMPCPLPNPQYNFLLSLASWALIISGFQRDEIVKYK